MKSLQIDVIFYVLNYATDFNAGFTNIESYSSRRTLITTNGAVRATATPIKSWKKIPGPSSLPVLGQLHNYLPGGPLHNLSGYELWDKMYKTYGPIVKLNMILMPEVLVLMDPKSIAQIYHGETHMPKRPGFDSMRYYRLQHRKTKEQSIQSAGLAFDQGETWKQLRSKLNPIFLQTKIIKLYTDSMDGVAQDMVARLKSLRNDDGVIQENLKSQIRLWALEAIAVFVLGGRINCLDGNLSENSTAFKLLRVTSDILKYMQKLDMKPSLWKYYPTKSFKEAMETYKDCDTITKELVHESMKKIKASNKPGGEKGILEKMLAIDEDMALSVACDTLGAGIDTITAAVTATLYFLATNLEKQQKLREEVRSKQGNSYLKACIKESLRMLPPTSMNLRQTTKEYTILDYQIPKGTNVVLCHVYTSLLESQFPRAHEYIPERWTVDRSHPLYYGNAEPFAYAPFGAGVRTCIGIRIIQIELETLVSKMIESFHIKWTGPPPNIESLPVNNITGPVGFIFKDV